jgi:hypothetical protein
MDCTNPWSAQTDGWWFAVITQTLVAALADVLAGLRVLSKPPGPAFIDG